MTRYLALLLFLCTCGYAQPGQDQPVVPAQTPKATIDMYRIVTLDRDTTYVDTSLTIQSDYKFNYLRRDHFGLLPLPNEGQPYNTLQFSLNRFSALPHSGRQAKHFKYYTADQIRYYSVATPLTELYFKTVMEQGQNLDAFVTINTSPNLNFSIAYNGLRSLGKYINQLSSTGNFRLTTSYQTKDNRYHANFHFVAQDILNGENSGLTNTGDFESGDPAFNNRARLEVYNRDAESFLEGKRLFLDHHYKIINTTRHSVYIDHQINHEYKFFEYRQPTIASQVTGPTGGTSSVLRFGPAFVDNNLRDRSRYNHLINRVGATYENGTLGQFSFFAEDYRYNYFYDRNLILADDFVPGLLSDDLASIGGRYKVARTKWNADASLTTGIAGRHFSSADATITIKLNNRNALTAGASSINKIPDLTYNLHQSRFQLYNWSNNFKNEKINTVFGRANTQWLNAEVTAYAITDKLFFSDDDAGPAQIVTPIQYDKTIGYVSVKLSREFRFRKWALDNTILFQKVTQDDPIVNVPDLTHRHTLYYSGHFFKRALYVQTGVTLNMFTKYYMDNYNPVVGEFFVQNEREIGNFPMIDFFINGRIRQTRIFIKAEHLNALFGENSYFSTPDTPYRDFTLRFGLVWNFFQ